MAFNLTGVDPEMFFAINTVVHVSIFSLVTVPTIILCVLCVVALLLTKEIHWKIRMVLINVLAAQLVYTLGATALYLGYPLRVYSADESGITCTLASAVTLLIIVFDSASIALYSIVAYLFIKHGEKKIKWQVVVVYLTIIWLVGITLTVLELSGATNFVITSNGFCVGRFMEDSSLLVTILVAILLLIVVPAVITLTFSILTGRYIKYNTIEGNSSVKKAVAKVLLFQWIRVAAVVLQYPAPLIAASIQPGLILSLLIDYIFGFLLFEVAVLINPIVFLIFLKPIRTALKDLCKKIKCGFCATPRPNAVPDNEEIEMTDNQITDNIVN